MHRIHVFVSSNFLFLCDFSVKVTVAFLADKKQWKDSENYKHTFRVRKLENDVLFHIFDQIKFSRVHVLNRTFPFWHDFCMIA